MKLFHFSRFAQVTAIDEWQEDDAFWPSPLNNWTMSQKSSRSARNASTSSPANTKSGSGKGNIGDDIVHADPIKKGAQGKTNMIKTYMSYYMHVLYAYIAPCSLKTFLF